MLAKTFEEDGLEICTKGMQKPRTVDKYVRLGAIRSRSMVIRGGSKARRPTQRLDI